MTTFTTHSKYERVQAGHASHRSGYVVNQAAARSEATHTWTPTSTLTQHESAPRPEMIRARRNAKRLLWRGKLRSVSLRGTLSWIAPFIANTPSQAFLNLDKGKEKAVFSPKGSSDNSFVSVLQRSSKKIRKGSKLKGLMHLSSSEIAESSFGEVWTTDRQHFSTDFRIMPRLDHLYIRDQELRSRITAKPTS